MDRSSLSAFGIDRLSRLPRESTAPSGGLSDTSVVQRLYLRRAELVAMSALLGLAVLAWLFTAAGEVFSWHRAGQPLAAAALFIAAVYEFIPLKTRCLGTCRSPLSFLTRSWQDGPRGALSMGIRHGESCLGCCWALMVALVALGAMSLTWMAVVAAWITAEKLLPWRRTATAAVAATLLALAIGVGASADVPGLTVPGGMSSASAMKMMR